jgi:amino acid adenylation domain-containing protein/non-ribosomal peptide synthase protein (TIGR01720 family)
MDRLSLDDASFGSAKRALLEALLKEEGIEVGPPISRVGSNPAPLSFAQERLWFLQQLDPAGSHYNLPVALRLAGPLNVAALEQALAEIVRRHEALRTCFVMSDENPVQLISPPQDLSLPLLSLENIPEPDRNHHVHRTIREIADQPFDLTRAPLMRLAVLRLRKDEHVFVVVMHHIVSDAWSMRLFARELAALYQGCCNDRQASLPDLPIQYGDFALWQRQWLQGEILDAQLAYWKQHLSDISALDLPASRPRPAVQSHSGARHKFHIGAEELNSLRELCRREGVTLFMAALALFDVLLHRYSGQRDIVVGTPIAGRTRSELEPLIGFFINTLVLRCDLSGNPTFRELLRRSREVTLAAYSHQDVPFEKLVEELQPERDLSRTPLFQVMLVVQQAEQQHWEMEGLKLSTEEVYGGGAKFDLKLFLRETQAGIEAIFEYSTDLYDPEMIERMARHFEKLVKEAAANPEAAIGEIEILGEDEREQILVRWNDTKADYRTDKTIIEQFEEQVESGPGRIAVVCEQEELSYEELNWKANQLGRYLRKQGVGAETLVGICVERSLEMIVGLMGILKSGAAYLPLDPTYPTERLIFMLRDSGTTVLLTQSELRGRFAGARVRLISPDIEREQIAREGADNLEIVSGPQNLAYVIYTSASTGKPKGVGIEHQQIVNYASAIRQRLRLQGGRSYATVSTLAADLGNTMIFPALTSGGELHVIPTEKLMDGEKLGEHFQQEEIDYLKIVPSHLAGLNNVDSRKRVMPRRMLVVGGEASPWGWVEGWQELEPECAIVNHYGPTETTVGVITYEVKSGDAKNKVGIVPLGRPLGNVQVYVLDERMGPVPVGVPGELYVGGKSLARGYVNHAALTAEQFVPNPFSKAGAERLYRTGDRVRYLEDGNLEFLGRVDSQLKIRGYRVELGEIEAALSEHPAIEQAVVLAQAGESGDKRLTAYVAPQANSEDVDVNDLRSYLKEMVPDYMVPTAFLVLKEMPLTPNGKVDRKALPRLEIVADQQKYAGPRNTAEEILCGIWSELLRVERVGVEDNFFHLGGDSILSIQVIARAARRGLRLTPKQLFEHQTIAGLAKVAGQVEEIQANQGKLTGSVLLTPVQRWFFEQELAVPHHYNQSMLLEPRESLDPQTLKKALAHLLNHHDALRFRFVRSDDGWRQIAGADEEAAFEWIDLSSLSAEKQSAAQTLAATTCQAGLNLSEGPLLRAVLFDLGKSRPQRLLIVIHHLVVDGVSWRILLEDLETAYRQLIAETLVRLPAKTTSFARWARHLSEYVQEPSQQLDLAGWLAETEMEVTALPSDGPGGPNTVASARTVTALLSAADTYALVHEAPRAYNTRIEDVLITALAQACRQWSAQPILWLTIEGHGREPINDRVDLSRTVGWFTSLHPARMDLSGVVDGGEALKTVKEQLRRPRHKGLGYGLWRYLSNDQTVISRLQARPGPELSFNYLGQFDQTFAPTALFRGTSERHGPPRSSHNLRRHSIEINGLIMSGELRLVWTYSEHLHRRDTIERVAAWHLSAVQDLITHCRSAEVRGYTPSDLPGARISERDLAVLLGTIDR